MKILAAIFLSFALVACASRREVAEDYRENLGANPPPSKTNRTVLVILVDGLPVETLSAEFSHGHLPNLRRFYLGRESQFHKARTVFPSLTYPAIASLLGEAPVDKTGVYGNTIVNGPARVNFEAMNAYPALNAMIAGHGVFERLAAKGLRTVSFDYAFHGGATAYTPVADLKAGLSIADEDYRYVDAKTISSLEFLLRKTPPRQWPDLIFVHLIGVDLTSHDAGPEAQAVTSYLESLDESLNDVFSLLAKTEARGDRAVVSLLTADHGFDLPVRRSLDLEGALHGYDKNIRVLNEGRYLSLFLPADWSEGKRMGLMAALTRNPDIDVTALGTPGGGVDLNSSALHARVLINPNSPCASGAALAVETLPGLPSLTASTAVWRCEEQLDETANNLFYPYFVPEIAHYFQSANHPDAVVIPKPGVSFSAKYAGQHGGPTPREIFVPLLLHGASIPADAPIPPLYKLLGFM